MRELEIISKVTEFDDESELTLSDRSLLNEARKSMKAAYAPYSHFQVGAAVLLENGKILLGNNQENAAYPIGLCAERVAIFAASANYPDIPVIAIAVCARSEDFFVTEPVTPCGACRQAVSEYEHRYRNNIRLIMTGETGKILVAETMKSILPFQFNGDSLKPKS